MELSAFKWLALTTLFAVALSGGLVPLRFRGSKSVGRFLSLGNMFAGGIFLGGGLLHLLPEANANYESAMSATDPTPRWPQLLRAFPVAFWLCGVGFFAILAVEESALAWTAAKQRKLATDHRRGLTHPPLSAPAKLPPPAAAGASSNAGGDGWAASLAAPLLSPAAHDSADSFVPIAGAVGAAGDGSGAAAVCYRTHAPGDDHSACELAECAAVDDPDARTDADAAAGGATADGRSPLQRMASHLQAEAERELAARVITSLAPRATLHGTDSPPATPRRPHHHHHHHQHHPPATPGRQPHAPNAAARPVQYGAVSSSVRPAAATDEVAAGATPLVTAAGATVPVSTALTIAVSARLADASDSAPGHADGHAHTEGHGHAHAHGEGHGEADGQTGRDGGTAHEREHGPEHEHEREHDHDHMALDPALASGVVAYVLVLALSFHSVFEGIAFGTQTTLSSAVALFVAIAAHTPLAGFALGVSLLKAQAPARTLVACIVLFAATVPAGALLGMLFSAVLSGVTLQLVSACTQAFASGTFLFVALGEIIPKELAGGRDKGLKVLLCCSGFIGMALIKLFDD